MLDTIQLTRCNPAYTRPLGLRSTPTVISATRGERAVELRWQPHRTMPGVTLIFERAIHCADTPAPLDHWRLTGRIAFLPSDGVATLSYKLAISGKTVIQSWPANSLAEAKCIVAGYIEKLALDVPPVAALDEFIARQGHDPHHVGVLGDNPEAGYHGILAPMSRSLDRLDASLHASTVEFPAPHIQEQLARQCQVVGEVCSRIENAVTILCAYPEWPAALRLRALYAWGNNLRRHAMVSGASYDDVIMATGVMCAASPIWPYPRLSSS